MLWLLMFALVADPDEERLGKVLVQCDDARRARIAQLKRDIPKKEQALRAAKALRNRERKKRVDAAEGALRDAKEELARIRDENELFVPRMPELSVGKFGRLEDYEFRVRQVLGADKVLATWGEQWLWIEGFEAAGVVDDQRITIAGEWLVTGTKTYATAIGGGKTVLLIEPYNLAEKVREYQKQKRAEKL